jgi:hypothetical protein
MSYLITTRALEKVDFKINNFFVRNNSEHIVIDFEPNQLILIDGFVYDLILKKKLSTLEIKLLVKNCMTTETVFPENITGQYNIILLEGNKVHILSDFIGMKPLYYHFSDQVFVTNNIYDLIDFGFEKDPIALFQSMVPVLNTPLNTRTILKDVKLLRNGEYLSHDYINQKTTFWVDGMDIENRKIKKADVLQTIHLLQENANIYKELSERVILPISGGVDSRITLSSFKSIDDNFDLLSYGEEDYIDNKIANNIAAFIGAHHSNISFKNHLFPTVEEFETLIKNGGDYFLSSWFTVINELRAKNYSTNSIILLGDVLDTLRAKNVKSLRNRSSRIKYQLKNFSGHELKLKTLNIEEFALKQKRLYEEAISKLEITYPGFFDNLEFHKTAYIRETNLDIDLFLKFIVKKFKPKYQENLEEAFYISTWGAKTMSKQVNVFKGHYQSYVLMASRHIVKNNLNFSPLDRFEDKLTHSMLKKKGFNLYSHFPTSQIPFIAYDSNIYLKYLVWAFRSGMDQVLIKLNKSRLVKNIDWKEYYKNENNKILLESLLANVDNELKILPLDLYNKRASGELWPLSETDINTFTYLLKVNALK